MIKPYHFWTCPVGVQESAVCRRRARRWPLLQSWRLVEISQGHASAGAAAQFSTDFSKHSVPYHEILCGGPPKDGIAAIDEPEFVSVDGADAWLKPQEPVILIQVGDEARAYPI